MHRIIAVLGFVSVLSSVGWADLIEVPAQGSTVSGVSILSGWKCESGLLTVRFNGEEPVEILYGSSRNDTLGVCGDSDNGYALLINYNALGAGQHTAVVYDDGVEFDRVSFTVVTPGVEFLRGVSGSGTVTLSNGQEVRVEWSQGTQGFVATEFGSVRLTTPPPTTSEEQRFRELIGTWDFTLRFSDGESVERPYPIREVHTDEDGSFASGVDPLDDSLFLVIPFSRDDYDFFMADVDVLSSGDSFCSLYNFNQSGNRISGTFTWVERRGSNPSVSSCDASRLISTGNLTGRRR